jgi:formylglycine-generating enzyme required for sulfatase activity
MNESALNLVRCGFRGSSAPTVAAAAMLCWSLLPAAQAQTARLAVKGITIEFVTIPPGSFLMGSQTGDVIERPAHRVEVGSFQMARTEVTVRLFRAFTEATGFKTQAERDGSTWLRDLDALEKGGRPWRQAPINWRAPGFAQSDDDPVVCVSWDDATALCEWLSKESGQPLRLPAEAEWEYACRAGTTGDYAGDLEEVAWYRQNSGGKTHPVGQKKPNAWGLYDMHGNAWEWCSDTWRLYEGAPKEGGPDFLRNGRIDLASLRPLRGGAWGLDKVDYRSGDLRASSRLPYPRTQSCNNSGVRIARTIEGNRR